MADIVENRSSVSNLTSRYNDFLFATICEEANGMRLSILSALARMNVDPWEEAARLASMPKAIAEQTLVSTLDHVSGRSWNSSEAAVLAGRLVRLLPQGSEGETIARTKTATASSQQKNYWWIWVGFAIAVSLLSPHYQNQAATTAATSESSATSPLNSNSPHPDAIGQSR
jgi:hypothetical protein